MNKYSHIETMDDLTAEIEKLSLKKEIIRRELRGNRLEIKDQFSFPRIITDFFGLEISGSLKSKMFTLTRAAIIIFSLFKGGKQMLRSIQGIFK